MKKIMKVFILITLVIGIISAQAATLDTHTNEGQITYPGSSDTSWWKTLDGNLAFCASGLSATVINNSIYESNGTSDIAAKIFEAGGASSLTRNEAGIKKYFEIQAALNQKINNGSDCGSACSAGQTLANTASAITYSPISMSDLNITYNSSTSKYDGTATISGGVIDNYGTCSITGVTGITPTTSNGSISFSIPSSSITNNTTITLTCNGIKRHYYTATHYVCTNPVLSEYECSDLQELYVPGYHEETQNLSKNYTITIPKGTLNIVKYGPKSLGTGASNRLKKAGIKFKVMDSSRNEIEGSPFTTDENGQITIPNLHIGNASTTYIIEEINAPSGYIKAKSTIVAFDKNNTNVTANIFNEKTKVKISKTDATGKKELPGAKLSLLDKDGKILKKCIFDKDKNLITYSDGADAKDCTWVSTDKEQLLEGLPIGKYYLVEDLAPEGYKKSSEKILIEIKDTGAVKDKVEMKNALEVPVPDTLSARSALLLAVAMFDVALGIGIVTYVKKNKIEE